VVFWSATAEGVALTVSVADVVVDGLGRVRKNRAIAVPVRADAVVSSGWSRSGPDRL